MGDVVDITGKLQQKRDAQSEYLFSVSVYATGRADDKWTGIIHDIEPNEGEERAKELRNCADIMEHLVWLLRQQAEDIAPSDDGHVLATVKVFESSRVSVRVNDDRVQTDAQIDWLEERFDDAKTVTGR